MSKQYQLDPTKRYEPLGNLANCTTDEKIDRLGKAVDEVESKVTALEHRLHRRLLQFAVMIESAEREDKAIKSRLDRLEKIQRDADQLQMGF